MEKYIKNNQSIFDINVQYYGSMNYLYEFILDNKLTIDKLFGNYKGVTLSFRDELLNISDIKFESYAEPQGSVLTEIEGMSFTRYLDYKGNKYITNNLDIAGANLSVDIIFDPVDPTVINYSAKSKKFTVAGISNQGKKINANSDGVVAFDYIVNKLDGSVDKYGHSITVNNQKYENITLKDQIPATASYGDLFFSEMTSNDYRVDGTTHSETLTTTNHDLDPTGAYYTDIMPSILIKNSLFRPLADEPNQALNISYSKAFHIEQYPGLCIKNSPNLIEIYNKTTATSSGDFKTYPEYLGSNISVDYLPIKFNNRLTYTTSPQTMAARFEYSSNKDITIHDYNNGMSFNAASNVNSLIISNFETFRYGLSVLEAEFLDTATDLKMFKYEPIQELLINDQRNISPSQEVLAIDSSGFEMFILDMYNNEPYDRDLMIDVNGVMFNFVLLSNGMGDPESKQRFFFESPSFTDIKITAAADNGLVKFDLFAVGEFQIEDMPEFIVPKLNNIVDVNLNNKADDYKIKLNSNANGMLTVNGQNKTISGGDNVFDFTTATDFSTLSMTMSGNVNIKDIELYRKNTTIHTTSGTQSILIDLNINQCPERNWNLFTMNYKTDDIAQFFFNAVPIRYLSIDGVGTYSASGEFIINTIDSEDNELVLHNPENQSLDMITLDSQLYTRDDCFDMLDFKYTTNEIIYDYDFDATPGGAVLPGL